MQPSLEEQEFVTKYWHANTEVVTVINPTKDDYDFQATVDAGIDIATGRPKPEARQYRVPAGGTARFPGSVANMYLDQMSKLLSQQENKFERMVDFSTKAEYYDRLTADTEDLIQSYVPNPAYDEKQETVTETKTEEVPFAEATKPEAAKKA
jgi:hypothetical protein